MLDYRYSLGLLELAAGGCLLLLALCLTVVQSFDVTPPVGFLPAFIAAPLFFWLATRVQERLPLRANLKTYTYSRPETLIVMGICLLVPVTQILLLPASQSGGPVYLAAMVSAMVILLGGTGPRVAYLVGGTLLLGLGLALYGPASYATAIFCTLIGLVLIPTGVATLRRELRR